MLRWHTIAAAIAGSGAIFFSIAYAANPFAITFPIAELGNCNSMEECRVYCDKPDNSESCTVFAESRGLASKKQVDQVKALRSGPGGCQGEEACRTYCEESTHGEECIAFAEKNGFISKNDAAQTRKFLGKPGPGGCRGNECKTYCAEPKNHEECLAFAEKNGFIGKEEANRARILREPGPGGCANPQECKVYCDNPEHLDACIDFGVKNGFMSVEEAARVKKLAGKGPGGCSGRGACEAYCHEENHAEECLNFAEQNDLIPKEEAARARKFLNQTGPGGCRGEACRTYCESPDHAEECIDFGAKQGFIKPEEAERAKKFAKAAQAGGPGGCKGEECRTYCENPEHHEECFNFAKEKGLIRPEEQKQFEQSQRIGEKIKNDGGPGGCRGEGECAKYCSDSSHADECIAFGTKFSGMSAEDVKQKLEEFRKFGRPEEPSGKFQKEQEFGRRQQNLESQDGQKFGPGGCRGFTECSAYCSDAAHQEECKKFGGGPQNNQRGEKQQGQEEDQREQGKPFNDQFQKKENEQGQFRGFQNGFDPSKLNDEQRKTFEQFKQQGLQGGAFAPPPGDRSGVKPGEQFGGGSDEQKFGFPSGDRSGVRPGAPLFGADAKPGEDGFFRPPGDRSGVKPGEQFGGQGEGIFTPPPGDRPGAPPDGRFQQPPPKPTSFAPAHSLLGSIQEFVRRSKTPY